MQENIALKYVEIERQLVNKFREALPASDVKRMKLYASTLKPFLKVCYRSRYSPGVSLVDFVQGKSVSMCVVVVVVVVAKVYL